MYILEKKWKKHDLITAVDHRYSFFYFFFGIGEKVQQKLLTWGRQGKEGKPSCSCDHAIGVLGAASLQGLSSSLGVQQGCHTGGIMLSP